MIKPQIQYTKSGNINIAYQVFGSGQIDMVYIPGWVSNIDWMWACPELVAFFEELGKIARVVLFDKRGTGLSDRVVDFSTLEERMDDIKAVMDAIDSKKAILFGHSEGGSVSALFSATYPNRVISLITFGIFAKRIYSENYPWAPTTEERQKVYDMIENSWGGGKMKLESLVPSKAQDTVFMNWLASYFRSGASPSAALKITKMNTQVDIIDILKYIKVPTLILQRTNDIDVKIEEGKFIADRIQNSKFVELEGSDHLFWAGNYLEVINQIKDFIKNLNLQEKNIKGLKTIVFGKVNTILSGSTKKGILKSLASKFNGELTCTKDNNIFTSFKVSGNAVKFGLELLKVFKENGTVSLGVYLKESLDKEAENLDDRDKYIINVLTKQFDDNEILVVENIKFLLTGISNIVFDKKSSVLSYNSTKLSGLFTVKNKNNSLAFENTTDNQNKLSQYNAFLENVIKAIKENYDDSKFGIQKLTSELGIGERQLQRKLKELTGKSPNQFITSYKLNKAKEALKVKSYTISEIAFKFGFSSPSYFSKCFKKEFGMSPNEIKFQ